MNEWERNSKMAEEYRKIYPPGTRLLLINMNDPYAPIPSGTRGTVDHIDDQAQIFMKWDNHRSLPIVPGEDSFRKLTAEELAEEQSSGIDATESGPEMQM